MKDLADNVGMNSEAGSRRYLSQKLVNLYVENGVLREEVILREFSQDGEFTDRITERNLFDVE